MVTNVAITTTYAGIRTVSGMSFDIREITTFEPIKTNVVASPIPNPLKAEEVVARAGQVPRTSTKIGFSLINPFVKFFH
jgi:hypothetical protein